MDRDEMVRIDQAITDAIAAGELDAFDRLMGPGLAGQFKEGIGEIRQAFPDYAGTVTQRLVEGDRMAVRFVYHGTHKGRFLGVEPTGRRVRFTGTSMNRFEGGVMVEADVVMDWLDVLEQIGGFSET